MQNLRNRYILFLTLVVFVISTMTPFFAVYSPTPSEATKTISELFGGKILICTGNGFKWVKIAELEQEKQHIPSDHYKCPLCYIASHVPSTVLSGQGVLLTSVYSFNSATILYSFYNYTPSPLSISADIKTRAPPFFFVS